MKTILVVGASGATGKWVVAQLLQAGHQVKVIVRPGSKIPEGWNTAPNLTIIQAKIAHMTQHALAPIVQDCNAVVSCLGHNLSLKGIYGKPRNLVTQAVRSLCEAISVAKPQKRVQFILMCSAGVRNHNLQEHISFGQRVIIGLLRLLLPPHRDNEQAAEYLRSKIGRSHPCIDWVVVRPDSLIDAAQVTAYKAYPSPTQSAIFKPGKTSRIHVADFMVRLILNAPLWETWKGQMPVLYNE
jgi:putative NADH-flavin reductase